MLVLDAPGQDPDESGYDFANESNIINVLLERGCTIAKRYGSRIKYIQIFNEIDNRCIISGDGRSLSNFNESKLANIR